MADELPEKVISWSQVRSILAQGAAIQQDYAAGNHSSYEEYSARLDAAARDREDQLNTAIEESTRELRERLERAQADLSLYVEVSSVLDGMTGRAPTLSEWEQIKKLAKQIKGGIMLDLAIREAKEGRNVL